MMSKLIHLPQLAANVEEATIGAWKKSEGDSLAAGDPIVEIITSKATFDLESPAGGILLKRVAPTNSTVPVGYIVAIVGEAGENVPDVSAENNALVARFRGRAQLETQGEKPKVRATPGARRLAKESGIDIAAVPPGGTGDLIREEDVRSYIAQHPNP